MYESVEALQVSSGFLADCVIGHMLVYFGYVIVCLTVIS